jgi:hypothetical protein
VSDHKDLVSDHKDFMSAHKDLMSDHKDFMIVCEVVQAVQNSFVIPNMVFPLPNMASLL